jgi:RNA polymerase sigma-70 factor (ECF subfamily)
MADRQAWIPLILLAQTGDRAAFAQLLREIQEPLYGYLVRLVANEHLAEDILQEVFVLIWRKLAWLREPELFRPWAWRIASREAFRRLRKERSWTRHLREPLAEEPAGAPPVSAPPEWLHNLSGELAELSPASRAVLVLHYLQGMTLREVADVLELSIGTVKSRLAFGLAQLRDRLAQKGFTL